MHLANVRLARAALPALAASLALAACSGATTVRDGATEGGDVATHPDGTSDVPMPPGDAPPPPTDATSDAPTDATMPRCGNGIVEPGEQCDDGNRVDDDECSNACRLRCGNGVVDMGETCDTAIAAGMPGACPTSCDDMMPCTTDTLSGMACSSQCVHGAITAPAPGDMCCPPGATSATDPDCHAACGNGVLDTGEACDTTIPAGMPGACPTMASCNDGVACTTDALTGGGTCAAACTHTPITVARGGDMCCPPGATPATDSDCTAGCGDRVVTPPETCDTAIAAGMPGACPTSCNDGMACTTDALINGGTCTAQCRFTPITTPMPGDMCCPPGATMLTDTDCRPVCGNRAVEMGEQCDDGNTVAGDGCSPTCQREPTAFRINSLILRDPHAFTSIFGLCTDITSQMNTEFRNAVTTDGTMPPDGLLDLSIAMVFRPLDQSMTTNTMDVVFPNCTAPLASTRCTRTATSVVAAGTATNQATGTCLDLLAGTTSPTAFMPVPTLPTGPCFASDMHTLTVNLGGTMVTLRSARLAATYSGVPASQLINGLIRGFLSDADANATILPTTIALVGGRPLSAILPGGMGNCRTGVAGAHDVGPDGTTPGWWFYMNFTAVPVPYTEP